MPVILLGPEVSGCGWSVFGQKDVILSFQAAPGACVNVKFRPAVIGWVGYLLQLEGKWCNCDFQVNI